MDLLGLCYLADADEDQYGTDEQADIHRFFQEHDACKHGAKGGQGAEGGYLENRHFSGGIIDQQIGGDGAKQAEAENGKNVFSLEQGSHKGCHIPV